MKGSIQVFQSKIQLRNQSQQQRSSSRSNERQQDSIFKNKQVKVISSQRNVKSEKKAFQKFNERRKIFSSEDHIAQNEYNQNQPANPVNVIIKENELLKEEVKLLHALLKEALPVFSKITEEIEGEENSQIQQQTLETNSRELIKLQQSLNQIQQSFNKSSQNQSAEIIENVDFEASILDEKKVFYQNNRLLTTNMYHSNTNIQKGDNCQSNYNSTGTFINNNKQDNSPASLQTIHINQIYNIDKRGKLKDLNKASKNFNLPFNIEKVPSGKDLLGSSSKKNKQAFSLNNLNLEQVRELKEIIQKINKSPYEKNPQLGKNFQINIKDQDLIDEVVNKVYSLNQPNSYFDKNFKIDNSRNNFGIKENNGKEGGSENFCSANSYLSEDDNMTQSSIINKLEKPKNVLQSQIGNLQTPFFKFHPTQAVSQNVYNLNSKIQPQGPNRKEMNYPNPVVIDQHSQHFECQPSFVTTTSYQSSESSPSHHSHNSQRQQEKQLEDILNDDDEYGRGNYTNNQTFNRSNINNTSDQIRRDEKIEYMCSYDQKPLKVNNENEDFSYQLSNNHSQIQEERSDIAQDINKQETSRFILQQQEKEEDDELQYSSQKQEDIDEQTQEYINQESSLNDNARQYQTQRQINYNNHEQEEEEKDLKQYAHQIREVNFDKEDHKRDEEDIIEEIIYQHKDNQMNNQKQGVNHQYNLSSMTGGTIFQESSSYDPSRSMRCVEDLPQQQEFNCNHPHHFIGQDPNVNCSTIQMQRITESCELTNNSNVFIQQMHATPQNKNNIVFFDGQHQNKQSTIEEEKELEMLNQISEYHREEEDHQRLTEEDSLPPTQQVLCVIQESHPDYNQINQQKQFNTVPNKCNEDTLYLNTNSSGKASYKRNQYKESIRQEKNQNKSNLYDMPRKRQSQKWSSQKQKETELAQMNQRLLQTQKGISVFSSNEVNHQYSSSIAVYKSNKNHQKQGSNQQQQQQYKRGEQDDEEKYNQYQDILAFNISSNQLQQNNGSTEENIISVLDVDLIENIHNQSDIMLTQTNQKENTTTIFIIENKFTGEESSLQEEGTLQKANKQIDNQKNKQEEQIDSIEIKEVKQDKILQIEEIQQQSHTPRIQRYQNDEKRDRSNSQQRNRYHSMAQSLMQQQQLSSNKQLQSSLPNNDIYKKEEEKEKRTVDEVTQQFNQKFKENENITSYLQNSMDYKEQLTEIHQEEILESQRYLKNEELTYKHSKKCQNRLMLKNDSEFTLNQIDDAGGVSRSRTSSGRSRLEVMLDEFIKENILVPKKEEIQTLSNQRAQQIQQQQSPFKFNYQKIEQPLINLQGESQNFICKANMQNLFDVKGLSQNSSSVDLIFNDQSQLLNNLERSKTPDSQKNKASCENKEEKTESKNNISVFEGQTLVVDLKISPIKMKCQNVQSVIKEEPSIEDEESRVTQQSFQKNVHTENVSFLTLNSQVSLAKLDSKNILNTQESDHNNRENGPKSTKSNKLLVNAYQQQISLKKDKIKYFIGNNQKENNNHSKQQQEQQEFDSISQEQLQKNMNIIEEKRSSLVQLQNSSINNGQLTFRTPHKGNNDQLICQSYDNRQINFTTQNNEQTPFGKGIMMNTMDRNERFDSVQKSDIIEDLSCKQIKLIGSQQKGGSKIGIKRIQFKGQQEGGVQSENLTQRNCLLQERREKLETNKLMKFQKKLQRGNSGNSNNLKKNIGFDSSRKEEDSNMVTTTMMSIQTAREQYTNRTREEGSTALTQRDNLQMSTSRQRNQTSSKKRIQIQNMQQMKRNKQEEEKQMELEQKLLEKEEKIRKLLLKKKEQEDKIKNQRIQKEQQSIQTSQLNNSKFMQFDQSTTTMAQFNQQHHSQIMDQKCSSTRQSSNITLKQRKSSIQKDCGTQQRYKKQTNTNAGVKYDKGEYSSLKSSEKKSRKPSEVLNMKKNHDMLIKQEDNIPSQMEQNIVQLGAQTERANQLIDILSPNKSQPTERQLKFMRKLEEDCQSRRKTVKKSVITDNQALQISQNEQNKGNDMNIIGGEMLTSRIL